MAEYIEREALIAEYDRVHKGPAGGARKLMVEAPAADVVEVVRCKDCEHYKAYSDPLEGFYGQCLVRECDIGENDFCSYGIRKAGAEKCFC